MGFTPVAKQLQQRLEDRRAYFHNWLFQWHKLKDGLVEVDLFDGRKSHTGGIAFWGSPRDIYWDAITRGVRKEVLDQFAWVDEQVRRYNRRTAIASIDQAAGLLTSFARGVRRDAIAKDRILRGDGINFPGEEDRGRWHGTSAEEIRNYAEELKAALPGDAADQPGLTTNDSTNWPSRLNKLWNENQWWLGPVGLVIGLAGILIAILIWMPDRPLYERIVVFLLGVVLIAGIARSHKLIPYNRVYLDPTKEKRPFAKEFPALVMAALAGLVTTFLSSVPKIAEVLLKAYETLIHRLGS